MANIGKITFTKTTNVTPNVLTTVFTYTQGLGNIYIASVSGTSNANSDWLIKDNGSTIRERKNTGSDLNFDSFFNYYELVAGHTLTVDVINCDDFNANYAVDMRYLD